MALELRRSTPMPVAWIAERLQMSSLGYLTRLLYSANQGNKYARIIN
jgi:hypothetical protein